MGAPGSDSFTDMTPNEATSFLELALPVDRRPVDDVIDRLRQPDAEDWIASVLIGTPAEVLPTGSVELADLRALKEQSKRSIAGQPNPGERLTAIFVYFVAVAAALVQHRTMITGHDRREIEEILSDLAAIVPREWVVLLAEAVRTL